MNISNNDYSQMANLKHKTYFKIGKNQEAKASYSNKEYSIYFSGDQIYGLTWDKSTKRIVVLHEINGRRKITMFDIET